MRSSNSPSSLFRELVDNAREVHAPSRGTRFISSSDFASMSVKQEWLVRNLITRYEPLIIGGPKKCMKTSVQLELAISLAAGINAQFLQKFEVMKPCRVAMISGESGRATLQKMAKTICKAKNLDLASLPIDWCFEMPQLTQPETRERLSAMIRADKIDVMIFDPMYLGLFGESLNVNAGNVLQMGPMLQKVVDICIPHRCTPILVHHTKKLGKNEAFRPLELDDLSQAGFAEFARQWLLLSRRSEFVDGSGHHELWMRTGGSAGHSSTWCVDIDEGSESYNVAKAKWEVRVRSMKSVIEQKEQAKEERERGKENHVIQRILDYLELCSDGDTKSGIRESTSMNNQTFASAIHSAIQQGLIERCTVVKNKRKHDGFALKKGSQNTSDE